MNWRALISLFIATFITFGASFSAHSDPKAGSAQKFDTHSATANSLPISYEDALQLLKEFSRLPHPSTNPSSRMVRGKNGGWTGGGGGGISCSHFPPVIVTEMAYAFSNNINIVSTGEHSTDLQIQSQYARSYLESTFLVPLREMSYSFALMLEAALEVTHPTRWLNATNLPRIHDSIFQFDKEGQVPSRHGTCHYQQLVIRLSQSVSRGPTRLILWADLEKIKHTEALNLALLWAHEALYYISYDTDGWNSEKISLFILDFINEDFQKSLKKMTKEQKQKAFKDILVKRGLDRFHFFNSGPVPTQVSTSDALAAEFANAKSQVENLVGAPEASNPETLTKARRVLQNDSQALYFMSLIGSARNDWNKVLRPADLLQGGQDAQTAFNELCEKIAFDRRAVDVRGKMNSFFNMPQSVRDKDAEIDLLNHAQRRCAKGP